MLSPPRMKIHNNTINVLTEVLIVRANVVFNESLNTTLARTINTSVSTLIVLLCIFFLGGDSIRSFSFAMILGVVFGTLSSIFVAAPLAYMTLTKKGQKA